MEGPRNVKSFIIPAPTGGLNFKEALPMMRADTAISMSNLIPNGATVDVRGGNVRFAKGLGRVRAIATYNCSNGNSYLIPITQEWYAGSSMSSVELDYISPSNTPLTAGSADAGANYTFPIPTFINWGGYLFVCAGPTGKILRLGPPTGTGGAFDYTTDTVLVLDHPNLTTGGSYGCIGEYKERIYLSDGRNTGDGGGAAGSVALKIYYGNSKQIASAIPTENVYDISYLCQKGGEIAFLGSTTRQEGALSQGLFAVITDQGEMLVFQGSYPGSTTWSIVGRYNIPKPLGRRAFFYLGNSLHVVTQTGIYSFAELTSNYTEGSVLAFQSALINNEFPSLATYLGTCANIDTDTAGVCFWPAKNKLFVTLPQSAAGHANSSAITLCQDLEVRGWGALSFANDIRILAEHRNDLYGVVSQVSPPPFNNTYCALMKLLSADGADDVFDLATQDWRVAQEPISISAQLAANYNEDFSTTKTFHEVKALVQCKQPYSLTCGLAVDFDLRSAGANNYSRESGGTFGLYQPKFSTGDRENVGKCCIINLGGQFNGSDLPMKFVGFEVYYTEGGNW